MLFFGTSVSMFFSNQPFTGIQLGVFPDAAGIDELPFRDPFVIR